MHTNNISNFEWYDITGINQLYIAKIYQKFLNDANSIPIFWKIFFEKNNNLVIKLESNQQNDKYIKKLYNNDDIQKLQLINLFRIYGHKYADLDPIHLSSKKHMISELLSKYSVHDIDDIYYSDLLKNYRNDDILYNIYKKYKKIYCSSIGIEYMYIDKIQEKTWIQKYVENKFYKFKINQTDQLHLLKHMIQSETLEQYLNTKFPGSKRFSLEGAEVLIPMLHQIIHDAHNQLSQKIIIGMAHRGRLNVLVNVLGKKIYDLCNEFSNTYQSPIGTGDAKYHSGIYSEIKIKNRTIAVDLKPNPSHLEIINPVIMGSARASIEKEDIFNSNNVLPINIHGDAAIIGQGINQELLNMSQTRGYTVGGTIHIIINNQIGFTTSKKNNIRSSEYCTDIAKMIQAPVFHVNADHPESVIFIVQLALKFRYKFKKDVFIDLVCYRRNGHNEADEPNVTQPIMYKKIKNHPTVCKIYSEYLESKQIINKKYTDDLKLYYRNQLETNNTYSIKNNNSYIKNNNITHKNSSSILNLQDLAIQISHIPNDITVHNRIKKIYQDRYKMAIKKKLFDWGAAENLAYASLLFQGISCRLSGEDISRGTFFHRHAIIHDQNTDMYYIPLHNINNAKGKFYIWDSVLSEEAVLAFEYGYSIDSCNTLNIWEAQFGDFVNGAQIVIDQFITSGEQKWGIQSKLIILLPHGYEGQGPEHSSSRLERVLQLCAQDNIQVCIPSTSSQIYHILRKQALNDIKKPLVIISPKSLLRHPMACTSLLELETGNFKSVIHEVDKINITSIKRIILCCGKIYYELLTERRKNNQINVILIRIEQLYPFPKPQLLKLLHVYYSVKDFVWCQEEPKNQGAWNYIKEYLIQIIPKNTSLNYIGRSASAAPAVGSLFMHTQQQKKIIHDALNVN